MYSKVKGIIKRLGRAAANLCLGLQYDGDLSENEATAILQAYCPDPATSPLCKNHILTPEYDLTIIIPVYNAECFLEECLNSVLRQKTQYTFRIIAVNDGSTDGSSEILNRFSGQENLIVIDQENGGTSVARNAAIHELRSEYLMFLDSDDILTDGAIESLVCTAKQQHADIVQGGYIYFDSNSDKTLIVKQYENSNHLPPNGAIAGLACGKIYRSVLFRDICFPVGYSQEDTIITGIITHLADNIVATSSLTYKYRQHKQSASKTIGASPKAVHTFWVNLCVLRARQALRLKTNVDFYMHLLRLVVLNQARLRTQPRKIQYCVFMLTRKMLFEQRQGLNLDKMDAKYKKLEQAILDGRYMQYLYLCGMW